MHIDKFKSVAFAGYRTGGDIHHDKPANIFAYTLAMIVSLRKQGFDTFIVAPVAGFGVVAAKAVMHARKQYGDIRLVTVVPFDGYDENYSPEQKAEVLKIIAACDHVKNMQSCVNTALERVSDFMLDNASYMVYCYTSPGSENRYIMERAHQRGLQRVNIFGNSPG